MEEGAIGSAANDPSMLKRLWGRLEPSLTRLRDALRALAEDSEFLRHVPPHG